MNVEWSMNVGNFNANVDEGFEVIDYEKCFEFIPHEDPNEQIHFDYQYVEQVEQVDTPNDAFVNSKAVR